MENHPIPQDVTGFQFKLIGNMTVKQFAYLAAGGVLAVIFFYTPLPFFIKFPLVILFGASGIALAFLPLDGRPLDVMIGYFFKALANPNQYIYHHEGAKLSLMAVATHSPAQATPTDPAAARLLAEERAKKKEQAEHHKEEELYTLLEQIHHEKKDEVEQKEELLIEQFKEATSPPPAGLAEHPVLLSMQDAGSTLPTIGVPAVQDNPLIMPEPVHQPVPAAGPREPDEEETRQAEEGKATLAEEVAELKEELAEAEAKATLAETEQKNSKDAGEAHAKAEELSTQLQNVMSQKQQLEDELVQLRKLLEAKKKDVKIPPVAEVAAPAQTVRKLPEQLAKSSGLLHVPDVPNLIAGLVKDARGNFLPNILVEVKDHAGNSVRAFKTNTLGQFSSATPLANGIYTVELEDPKGQHQFEVIEIKANGEIMLPLEITSQDQRELLRKELFT